MRKVTFGFVLLSGILGAVCLVHVAATGICLPYPDPTPEQASYERFHLFVSEVLLFVAGSCCSLTCVVVTVWVITEWLRDKRR